LFYLYSLTVNVTKKVLIIENDQDIRIVVEFVLKEHGFETLSMAEPQDLSEIIPFPPCYFVG
jgi:two-component system phosphate regulon response regulator PhoB